ncbi:MAG: chromosome segregation protein SMC [Eubacterium sp.]
MYLKSIEIHGFKSFANKINFEFHNGITGIVGPNGSGKSNVADAVRWVLGEQKIKQLRGAKMEDVIFSGTENRKPLGFAFVAITLDNSDHKLAIDYDEVTVSRRLYRSGESEYLINGTVVRLKDINELFYDTGIGKEGYSIIGQGQIDKILSGKPEDRRELFDEAAGIVKFKRRKNAAVKKLEDENQNLTRVEDILSELERQVKPLEKQSEVAKKYLSFKDSLKTNEINLFLIDIDNIKKQTEQIENKLSIAQSQYDRTNDSLEQTKLEYTKLDSMIEKLNQTIDEKKNQLNDTNIKKEKLENQIMLLNEQINSARSNDEFLTARIASLSQNLAENETQKNNLESEKADIEIQLKELIQKQENMAVLLSADNEAIEELSLSIENYKAEIIELLNAKSQVKSNIQRCDTMIEQINIRKAELNSKLVKFQSEKNIQETVINDLENDLKSVNSDIININKNIEKINLQLNDLKKTNGELVKSIEVNQANYHRNKSQLEALKNITERYEGYGNSIKKIMELKDSKSGIIGVVADIIKVDKKYETAIETALGGNIQNIVTNTETTAKELIEYLKKNKLGRATFLPLSSMTGKTGFNAADALDEKGVLGLASELVNIKKEYSGVAKYLLGRIIVVDTIDNAIMLARKYKYSLRIVTLEGEFLNAGGSMTGGSYKNQSNLLGRRREIEDIERELERLKSEKDFAAKDLLSIQSQISVVSEELEKLNSALQEQYLLQNTIKLNLNQAGAKKQEIIDSYKDFTEQSNDISNKITDINKNSEQLNAELESWEERNGQLEELIKESSQKLSELKENSGEHLKIAEDIKLEIASVNQKHDFVVENISRVQNEINKYNAEYDTIKADSKEAATEIDAKSEAIESIKKEIMIISDNYSNYEKELSALQSTKEAQMQEHKDFFAKREELATRANDLDKEIYRLSNQLEKLEDSGEAKMDYMWNEYEITYGSALELRKNDYNDRNVINRAIGELKSEIKKLGDVNVNSIEEYKEVSERYQFMNSQHNDIIAAKENLMGIIQELDTGMRKQFKEKFAEITKEFDVVFKELFGGGKGTIELTGDEDILEAGINIISQPPGKKLQNMMQLSGGEKALTAICLLFAIQNLKPSPFCLLDEIEAALDGTNITRFAEYLHKLTKNTQFIVITHRRGTMSAADRLYGITMQEKGISTLVSVDLLDKELVKEEEGELS